MNRLSTVIKIYFVLTTAQHLNCNSQIANYVSNGSFEDYYNCSGPQFSLNKIKSWLSIDSSSFSAGFFSYCNNTIPANANTYQYPKSGNTYIITNYFCPNFCPRGYQKNRLKSTLSAGAIYCFKFHVSIANSSPRGINGFGAYFGGNTIDTITKCNDPLTYLTPQVINPTINVISDTLNWVPITGTFVANGTEKYLVLGNFLGDNEVVTAPIYSPSFPQNWSDILIDDVSCIEVNLPAYAGQDKLIKLGDSAFIGRQPDFAIDPGCTWYKLPNMTTPLDTISGLWVKPTVTSTYVVRQILDCSSEKWDTVEVHLNLVGNPELRQTSDMFKVFPNPSDRFLTISSDQIDTKEIYTYQIVNALGQVIMEEDIAFVNKEAQIATNDLPEGVYTLLVSINGTGTIRKKFVVAH